MGGLCLDVDVTHAFVDLGQLALGEGLTRWMVDGRGDTGASEHTSKCGAVEKMGGGVRQAAVDSRRRIRYPPACPLLRRAALPPPACTSAPHALAQLCKPVALPQSPTPPLATQYLGIRGDQAPTCALSLSPVTLSFSISSCPICLASSVPKEFCEFSAKAAGVR